MLNYNTILSNYDDKLTLMQWLNKVEQALKHASATSFSVNKKGSATISFKIDFADGTSLESGEIILQQGESVQSAAIVDGHLVLTLTNGDELDAGSVGAVSSFSIDASQHLIVTYQDGTTNDLGAIFNGNVNISGILTASSISTPELTTSAAKIDVLKPVEVTGALKATTLEQTQPNVSSSFSMSQGAASAVENVYNRFVVINGILHIVAVTKFINETGSTQTLYQVNAAALINCPAPSQVIDVTGKNVNQSSEANIAVETIYALTAPDQTAAIKTGNIIIQNTTTVGHVSVYYRFDTPLSIPANSSVYVIGRIALTLL